MTARRSAWPQRRGEAFNQGLTELRRHRFRADRAIALSSDREN
jgi:hypothetical protein